MSDFMNLEQYLDDLAKQIKKRELEEGETEEDKAADDEFVDGFLGAVKQITQGVDPRSGRPLEETLMEDQAKLDRQVEQLDSGNMYEAIMQELQKVDPNIDGIRFVDDAGNVTEYSHAGQPKSKETVLQVAAQLIEERMYEAQKEDWDECVDGVGGYSAHQINVAIAQLLDATKQIAKDPTIMDEHCPYDCDSCRE